MSSMKEFMEEQEIRGFLEDIQTKLNKTSVFHTTITDDTLEVAIGVFSHIYKTYQRLEKDDEEDAGTYIASCLGTYLMLFNQLSDYNVKLDS